MSSLAAIQFEAGRMLAYRMRPQFLHGLLSLQARLERNWTEIFANLRLCPWCLKPMEFVGYYQDAREWRCRSCRLLVHQPPGSVQQVDVTVGFAPTPRNG